MLQIMRGLSMFGRAMRRRTNLWKKVYHRDRNNKLQERCQQKNKMRIAFNLIAQRKDEEGNPMFEYAVEVEGVTCASAAGFSKKESQQAASEQALTRIRKEAKFQERLFEAKKEREAAAETSVAEGCKTAEQGLEAISAEAQGLSVDVAEVSVGGAETMPVSARSTDEFDLSDISAVPKTTTPEDIIAAAEEAAYADEDKTADQITS